MSYRDDDTPDHSWADAYANLHAMQRGERLPHPFTCNFCGEYITRGEHVHHMDIKTGELSEANKPLKGRVSQMGSFRLEAQWVGGHGCQRERKDGEEVYGCGRQDCPDCRIREFVADMNRRFSPESVVLRHWPGQEGEVQDDLLTRRRKGSF